MNCDLLIVGWHKRTGGHELIETELDEYDVKVIHNALHKLQKV